ncbi:tetratricopeptide repeat-containing glycosyltransferase family protein [Scleromatobacter humisilvae]|uniref:Tetratricopeptide repeat-containing glycosyltransferase family protein n=1 Tax=Scleromatobacter humisilvae TaxID=2897159 RepID=A0A9X1YR83_9BURK|nr:tetratricopeptide repeat-containing glycosyltransferase family protein [Scleromatobacter humisilvae]MCK9686976.1 tetratricopeptide repeat-containing glycosyltransferase family protein [Scleromatobacter humisilvae]
MDTGTPAMNSPAGPAALRQAHALFLQHRDTDAMPHARAAVQALPQRADAWTLLGIVQQRLGQSRAAEAAYREAIRVKPDYADAWTNLGNLLRDQDDLPGTLRAFQQAMRCAPASPEPAYNLGIALEHFGRWDGALAAFQAAIECDPQHADAHWNAALALLRAGRFEEGFREYEWRFRRGEPGPRGCPQPVWDGRPLAGRTILVWAEQGYGDALQFLRFVPEVARRGGRVVLEVMEGLQGLASRLPGVAAVVVRGLEAPAFDTHVALMSLPHVLGLAPSHADTPYLHAHDALARQWRERLAASGHRPGLELAVGLVWAGNPALRNSRERSPGFDAVRGLLDVQGTRFFSLQKGAGCNELAAHQLPATFVDLDREIGSFDDTAAVIASLDVVVTCDTAVAHLAGALGKPVIAMLPHTRDWRYGLHPHASGWYPSTQLFRQDTRGDWTSVLARVTRALQEAVASLPSQALVAAHA